MAVLRFILAGIMGAATIAFYRSALTPADPALPDLRWHALILGTFTLAAALALVIGRRGPALRKRANDVGDMRAIQDALNDPDAPDPTIEELARMLEAYDRPDRKMGGDH